MYGGYYGSNQNQKVIVEVTGGGEVGKVLAGKKIKAQPGSTPYCFTFSLRENGLKTEFDAAINAMKTAGINDKSFVEGCQQVVVTTFNEDGTAVAASGVCTEEDADKKRLNANIQISNKDIVTVYIYEPKGIPAGYAVAYYNENTGALAGVKLTVSNQMNAVTASATQSQWPVYAAVNTAATSTPPTE